MDRLMRFMDHSPKVEQHIACRPDHATNVLRAGGAECAGVIGFATRCRAQVETAGAASFGMVGNLTHAHIVSDQSCGHCRLVCSAQPPPAADSRVHA
jgi:hypothetical protein